MSSLENCSIFNIFIMIQYSDSNGKNWGDTPSATLKKKKKSQLIFQFFVQTIQESYHGLAMLSYLVPFSFKFTAVPNIYRVLCHSLFCFPFQSHTQYICCIHCFQKQFCNLLTNEGVYNQTLILPMYGFIYSLQRPILNKHRLLFANASLFLF